MTYRLNSDDPNNVFSRYGPTLAHASSAAQDAHPLVENVWVQKNAYAKQLVIEVWWTRDVSPEEATESVRAVRAAIRPWLEAEGVDATWHVTARRGRRRHPDPRHPLVPLLRDDYRETEVRTRWPKEPEYVDRSPRPEGVRKVSPGEPLGKARRRA